MVEGGGIWACMAFPFFAPRFFCPLELPASYVRVVRFDQAPPVPHPRPSRLFFLPTSHRRRSARVSEILNVAPRRSLSTDVRHPFRITNPEIRTSGPRTRASEAPRSSKPPGIENFGSRTSGAKKAGLAARGIVSSGATFPGTQRLPGIPVACPRRVAESMLAKFRPVRYDDRSRAGRRLPTGGGPQPARNDEPSDAREAAKASSKVEHSPARPR
jgi:hypothetical protein